MLAKWFVMFVHKYGISHPQSIKAPHLESEPKHQPVKHAAFFYFTLSKRVENIHVNGVDNY